LIRKVLLSAFSSRKSRGLEKVGNGVITSELKKGLEPDSLQALCCCPGVHQSVFVFPVIFRFFKLPWPLLPSLLFRLFL
jgi:hypothetical protein